MQSSSFVNNLGTRIRNTVPSTRLVPIDFTRGLVMILMALDHASVINPYHVGGEGFLGNRPEYPDVLTFLTRFVTHWCAPAFLFLPRVRPFCLSSWYAHVGCSLPDEQIHDPGASLKRRMQH